MVYYFHRATAVPNKDKEKNMKQEMNLMRKEAKAEGVISSGDILKEIFALIRDNFVGKTKCFDDRITLDFLNGQKFSIILTT